MSHRIPKVNSLIQKEFGKILKTEVDFPKDILISISKVDTSSDLRYADIKISVYPYQKKGEILNLIKSNLFKLQGILNKKLNLRPLPRIRIQIDESENKADRIDRLIEKIKREQ